MTVITSIAWLRKGGVDAVNRRGSSSAWSWDLILTLHWGKNELVQLDGAAKGAFELLPMIIVKKLTVPHWAALNYYLNYYQQNKQQESVMYLRRESRMLLLSIKKSQRENSNKSKLNLLGKF